LQLCLQLGVFSFGLLEDRNIGVGVLPHLEEILVRRLGLGVIARENVSAAKPEMRERADGRISREAGVFDDVFGFVNDAHSAAAEFLDDAVVRNILANQRFRARHCESSYGPLLDKSTKWQSDDSYHAALQLVAGLTKTGIYSARCRPKRGSASGEGENNVPLKMTDREVDGVIVVALDGRIVLGEETNAFREKIKSLLAAGRKKLLLNLDNITLIDSTGLGTLVSAHHSAASRGASLRLCKLGTKFQEVLQVTKLLTVFDVSDTEADGVRSFAK
jgi:anti-sigma B factor antagonist